ncbi:MAG: DNA polymerase I, partial [Planctomycetota bacterium]
APGYEADDILATIVQRFAGPEMNVVLISRDKDLDQLVDDHAVLYDPMKDETFDAVAIQEKKGYPPSKAVEVQALCGDSIDNIPGVPGVGPKTAVKLISKYGSAEDVLAHADEQTPKLSENLTEHADSVRLSRQLVELDRNVPIELDLEKMTYRPQNGSEIRQIFAELGFQRLQDVLDEVGYGGEGKLDVQATAAAKGQTTAAECSWECVDTPEKLDDLARRLQGVERLAVDTETTGTHPLWASLVGISLSFEAGHGAYVPVKGPLGATVLDVETVQEKLGPALSDEKIQKIGHHLKFDIQVLRKAGMELAGPMFDTLIAAHVLDSQRMTYKLDALAAEMLSHRCIPIEELIGRGKNQLTMDCVPMDHITPYAAEDAEVTLRLANVLAEQLDQQGLRELMDNLEMPLMPVLCEMEQRGIRVDPQALKNMQAELSRQADALGEQIVSYADEQFNPDSPKQLAVILFDQLQMPVVKRTKTGPSTDSSVLEELAVFHELPGLVLDYRKLTKLIGTYLKSLGDCIHPDTCRIHTSFHQAGTATGRLSSSDPNLQNIPVRTQEGRRIRSAFVPDDGYKLLSADYSQVELRVLAHLCQDATLMAAFEAGQDIHAAVAAEVFGVPLEEVTSEQRSKAKTVNFGIVYGQTAFGLAKTLRIPRGEAQEFITSYRKRFPRIQEFLQACVAHAKEHGHVETIFGRRRFIRDIASRNPQKRNMAERLAINSVVQGSAADLIKQAMVNIDRRIREEKHPSRLLLQIHDELVFEIPQDKIEPEREMIVEEMIGAVKLSVPLKVDVGVGDNWMEAK